MNITFEERQLMSLYNTGTRTGLIAALEEMRGYLAADETELRELTDSAIAKLRRMSDAEYDAELNDRYEQYHQEQYHCYRAGVAQIPVNKCFLIDVVYKNGC